MKILWITLETLVPMNTAGRMGVLKRLEPVCKYNDVYLYYFYNNEDENKKTQEYLSSKCKCYGYMREKNKLKLLCNLILTPYTVASRINKKMIADIDRCIKQEGIELINIDFPQMGYALMHLNNIESIFTLSIVSLLYILTISIEPPSYLLLYSVSASVNNF